MLYFVEQTRVVKVFGHKLLIAVAALRLCLKQFYVLVTGK